MMVVFRSLGIGQCRINDDIPKHLQGRSNQFSFHESFDARWIPKQGSYEPRWNKGHGHLHVTARRWRRNFFLLSTSTCGCTRCGIVNHKNGCKLDASKILEARYALPFQANRSLLFCCNGNPRIGHPQNFERPFGGCRANIISCSRRSRRIVVGFHVFYGMKPWRPFGLSREIRKTIICQFRAKW